MLSDSKSDNDPLYPPYPNPGAVPGWRGRLLFASWVAGGVLLCLHIEIGGLLLIPVAVWFVRMAWRTGRWRVRALDGLEARAQSITEPERERDIADILRIYGGKPFPKVKRRVEAIRAIPPRSE
jgi:hypothetical protein